jgi:FMN phosphatase YigB (HAD superfamily)
LKPRVVVFDLGKVLLDFDYTIAARRISLRGGRDTAAVFEFLLQTPVLRDFETGLLTRSEFHSAVCEGTGYCGDLADFSEDFGDIFVPIEPMVTMHAELRQRGVPTYIFSNTNDLAVAHIRARYPFFSHFDGYVYSFEHGAMKPAPKLYEVVERVTGLSRADLLYLDDRPENTAAGAERGWRVITHECPAKSRALICDTGLLEA